jgi:cell division septum initiation protein DivIVA
MSNLAEKFAEIERRVKTLVAENHSHQKRVKELEKELNQTRHVAQKSVKVHDKQVQLRERVEKILKDLEGIEVKKG